MPLVAAKLYSVAESRGWLGVNVAVKPSADNETDPASGSAVGPPAGSADRVMVAVVTVSGSTGLLNWTCTVLFVATLLALYAGMTLTTVGVERSAPEDVVNEEVVGLVCRLPAKSFTPVTFRVYGEEGDSSVAGINVRS